jgi:hypothetical protein
LIKRNERGVVAMIVDVTRNHSIIEERLRAKLASGKKINVLIPESNTNTSKVSLISEIAKIEDIFEVTVISHNPSRSKTEMYSKLGANLKIGGNLEEHISNLEVDLLFIENPHFYYEFNSPTHDFYTKLSRSVFERVLVCYVPYAYISVSGSGAYTDYIHRYSWKFYLESFFHLLESEKYGQFLPNRVVTGHPYSDPYFTNEYDFLADELRRYDAVRKVVWCPHHNPVFYGGVSLAEQELVMRNFLDRNEDVVVFFRPHPNLLRAPRRKSLVESGDYRVLLDNDIGARFNEYWLGHPRVVYLNQVPVYEYFKAADIIVHNCGGYQMEALMSGAQVINLVNPKILNAHVLQYRDHQMFCDTPESFVSCLQRCFESAASAHRKNAFGALSGHVPAGRLIAKDLEKAFRSLMC